RAVHLYEKGLFLLGPHQGYVPPLRNEELGDCLFDAGPEPLIIRLEDNPLCSFINGFTDVKKVTPHVDVLPKRVSGSCSRPPNPDTAGRKNPNAVNAPRIQEILLSFGDLKLDGSCTHNDLVGRGLEHTAFNVGLRVDSCYMTRWRNPGILV